MNLRETITFSTRAVKSHGLRSFLTALGIAVGVAAVVLLTSLGEGIHRYMLAEFTQFGTNLIGITPGKVPKFVRNFLQDAGSVPAAIRAYVDAVKNGSFPAPEHCF